MLFAIDELAKSLKYHRNQLEDNLRKIQFNLESNESLKACNIKHEETIKQIEEAIERLSEDGKAI